MPLSYLNLQIYGKMSDTDPDTFIWLHSLVKIVRPKSRYDPKGVFTYFENYNVEVRDRVKCVSGIEGWFCLCWVLKLYILQLVIAVTSLTKNQEFDLVTGVPVTTQWDSNGYYYPIQIAQFGLSHYSKYVVDGEPTRVVIEDGDTIHSTHWIVNQPSDLRIIPNPDHASNKVVEIQPTKGMLNWLLIP